jgi:transcriptional regulator with XRE-family HTH domain
MTINERLFDTLEKKSLKQSDLANFLELSTGQITAWKKRGTTPPAEYLINICKFLDISIYELLDAEPSSQIERIYFKLDQRDKDIVDNIFSRYQEQKSSTSKIG